MTVSRVAVTTGAPAGAGAFSPTLPTHAAGDRLVLFVVGKYETTTTPTINQAWTLIARTNGGTGAAANDTGQVFQAVYAKDALSGSETAPTVTPGGTAPNSWEWVCVTHRPDTGKVWRDPIKAAPSWLRSVSDTSTASPLTGTTSAFEQAAEPTAGDALFTVGNIPTDLGSALTAGATITSTGLSGGTVDNTTTNYVENALGQDTAAAWVGWVGFTGTSTAGVAVSMTITGATNHSGLIGVIALREITSGLRDFVGGDADGANSQTLTNLIWPPNVKANDVAVLAWGSLSTSTPTDPTGFTQEDARDGSGSHRIRLYSKVCVGTETGAISLDSNPINRQSAVLWVGRGFDVTDPFEGFAVFEENTSQTTHDAPAYTTASVDAQGVTAVLERSSTGTNDYTAPTSFNSNHVDSLSLAVGAGGTITAIASDDLNQTRSSGASINPGVWTSANSFASDNVFVYTVGLKIPQAAGGLPPARREPRRRATVPSRITYSR